MLANHRLAAAISDAAWTELARLITYRQDWRGGQVVTVDRWFPSSKTCSGCGAVDPDLTLAQRTYRCAACGLELDRDRNAAINLAAWADAQATLAVGGVVRCLTSDSEQRKLSRYALGYQWPLAPERALVKDDGAKVESILRLWSGTPGWPDEPTAAMYRAAIQFSSTAHCALEYHRWAIRSIPRPDGRRFQQRMQFPVHHPVLHILGTEDGSILPRTSDGSDRFVRGPYTRVDLTGVGHFPQEEAADRFAETVIPWLADLPPTN